MAALIITDPQFVGKRLLCEDIGGGRPYEIVIVERSSAGRVKVMFESGRQEWGFHPLIRVLEVLPDQPSFGQPSPCS